MHPKGKVHIRWTPAFAYAIGLLVTDGNLSPDGRHINFTSKDLELVTLFRKCLNLKNKIGRKAREHETVKKYFVVQFGDILFYRFLNSIGITSRKSKTIGALSIPEDVFFHFLRGHFDGDGSVYAYYDPRWRSSYMFYMSFVSASRPHLIWLQKTIRRLIGISGGLNRSGTIYQLRFAKAESGILVRELYKNVGMSYGMRKYIKVKKIMGEWRNLVDSPA